MERKTVVVLFDVAADDRVKAELIVEKRLEDARLLWQNDSTDGVRGTLDPIQSYVVVPAVELLDDAL